jgi:hypothetical protein
MEDYLSCGLKEEELEKGIQDLLNHLIVFLFSSKEVLKHLNQIGRGNMLSDLVISADSGD